MQEAITAQTEIKAGEKYTISTAEQLKVLAMLVKNGQDCKGAEFIMTQDIVLNPYRFSFNRETGFILCKDLNGTVLFAIGTNIPGEKFTSSPDIIYYGKDLLNTTDLSQLDTGDYSGGKVVCGNKSYEIEQWQPIGTEEYPFQGKFDGCGKQIIGLFNRTFDDKTGLFGVMGDAAGIFNVRSIDGYIRGETSVGGIVGFSKGGKVKDCQNRSSIVGALETGGIAGHFENGSIISCINEGTLHGCQDTGGIAGITYDTEVKKSKNKGLLSTLKVTAVGGIIGGAIVREENTAPYLKIAEGCKNYGNVQCGSESCDQCTGGIVGAIYNKNKVCRGFVRCCENYGNVSSNTPGIGGIVGYMEHVTVEYCRNFGTVTGLMVGDISGFSAIGGIAGYVYSVSIIKNCHNAKSGRVLGQGAYVGGIAGCIYAEVYDDSATGNIVIKECCNEALVECTDTEADHPYESETNIKPTPLIGCAGGIAGYIANTESLESKGDLTVIQDCCNKGDVYNLNSPNTGGLVGFCKDSTVENSCNAGDVYGQKNTGGLFGYVMNFNREDDRLEKCYNLGDVRGTSQVGIVVGLLEGENTIRDCYGKKGNVICKDNYCRCI